MSTDPLREICDLPGVADAVAQARAAVDGVRAHPAMRRHSESVAAETALRGARASAALAGADLPLIVVRRALSAETQGEPPVGAVVEGALRAVAETNRLQATWLRAPMQALARLHALAASGLVVPDFLGRPRPDNAVAQRLATLTEIVTGASDIPAVVVASVVHGEILTMQPFAVGSGVVARTAQRLTLCSSGFDPNSVTAVEVGHVELGRLSYQAAAAGYAGGGPDGVAHWVRHCAEATVLGARDAIAVCEALQRA